MENIQIIGIEDIKEHTERTIIWSLSKEYYGKIQRALKNDIDLTVHIKTYNKGGKQKEWEIKAKVSGVGRVFESTESDWELAKTLHKVFKAIEKQIEKAFRD